MSSNMSCLSSILSIIWVSTRPLFESGLDTLSPKWFWCKSTTLWVSEWTRSCSFHSMVATSTHGSGGSKAVESPLCCHMSSIAWFWHVAHRAERRIGGKGGFGYSVQIKKEEPCSDRQGGALCVVQDHKVICKHDCIGDMLIRMMSILIWLSCWPTQP